MLAFILARLSEPKTYAGLGVLLAGIGLNLPPGYLQTIITVVMIVAGCGLAIVKDKGLQQAIESGDMIKALERRVAAQEAAAKTPAQGKGSTS